MQQFKSLEDLGVKREDCYQNWMEDGEKEDTRYNDWLKQQVEYGIDERHTWNWSDDFMDYMYVHLEMFNRVNIVDFTKEFVWFDNVKYSVQDVIDVILKWMKETYYPDREDKFKVNDYKEYEDYIEEVKKFINEKHRILLLFATIIDHLNW